MSLFIHIALPSSPQIIYSSLLRSPPHGGVSHTLSTEKTKVGGETKIAYLPVSALMMSSIAPFCPSFLSSNHWHKLQNLSWVSLESAHRCQPPGWSCRYEQRRGRCGQRGGVWELRSGSVYLTGRAPVSWAGSISKAGTCHTPCTVHNGPPVAPLALLSSAGLAGSARLVSSLPGVLVFSFLRPILPSGLGSYATPLRGLPWSYGLPEVPPSGTTLTPGLIDSSGLVRHWHSRATAQHFVVIKSLHLNVYSGQDLFF